MFGARRGAAARGIALQRGAQILDQRLHAARLSANSAERVSILEAIWAIGFVGQPSVAKLSDSPIIQRFWVR